MGQLRATQLLPCAEVCHALLVEKNRHFQGKYVFLSILKYNLILKLWSKVKFRLTKLKIEFLIQKT